MTILGIPTRRATPKQKQWRKNLCRVCIQSPGKNSKTLEPTQLQPPTTRWIVHPPKHFLPPVVIQATQHHNKFQNSSQHQRQCNKTWNRTNCTTRRIVKIIPKPPQAALNTSTTVLTPGERRDESEFNKSLQRRCCKFSVFPKRVSFQEFRNHPSSQYHVPNDPPNKQCTYA